MSLFGSAGAGGGLFPRAAEADLRGVRGDVTGRPTPRGQHHGQSYAAVEPADEAGRLKAQIGPADRSAAWGFAAAGGQPPADVTGPGAPRDGDGR